ncbi:MAG: hypothetical protein IKS45_10900, partial [Thermoguttaceae bacterium]|nr:hypothetical protein [Thermoguttaceae bacterium]
LLDVLADAARLVILAEDVLPRGIRILVRGTVQVHGLVIKGRIVAVIRRREITHALAAARHRVPAALRRVQAPRPSVQAPRPSDKTLLLLDNPRLVQAVGKQTLSPDREDKPDSPTTITAGESSEELQPTR